MIEGLSGGRVVGREIELAAVAAFLDASPGGPTALVIEGEAGVGKTTIVRAALERASSAGMRAFLARPGAGEIDLPYAGLGDLLADARTDALVMLAGPQRAAIEAALGREGSSAIADEHALSLGVLELLRLEGGEGDLLLVVDDVQWLDRPTVSALTFALRRFGTLPVRVLLASRTESGSPTEMPLGLGHWEGVDRVAVGPLSATELGIVLRQNLHKEFSRPRLEAIERAAGGNPMFALELVRQGFDQRVGRAAPTLPLALGERLRGLDADARAALTVAGAMLRPSADLLLQVGVGREELRSALETGIMYIEQDRLSFAHPLLGAAAYELLLPEERREIHARLALAALDAIERGHHISRSADGRDEAAASLLDLAAEEAGKLGDHAGAATFLLRAAELSLHLDGNAAGREVRAATELVFAGDVIAAAILCRSLIDRLPAGVERARARQTLIYCSVGPGMSYADCVSQLALALDDAGADKSLQAELHLDLTEIFLGTCSLDEAVKHSRLAGELAEEVGATATAVSALASLGFAESMLGRGVTDSARQAFERWDGTFGWAVPPRMALACVCIPALAFDEAEELLVQELAVAQERGLESIEVVVRAHLAELQLRAGRWAEALTNARLAVEHARQATEPQIVTGTSYSLAMTEALLGQLEPARNIASESLAAAKAAQDFWFVVSHRAVLGLVALTEGESQAAVDVLEPAWALMLGQGLGDLSLFPVAQVLGEALVAVGRFGDSDAIAERLKAAPLGAQPWCRAMANRLAALAAGARGDHDAARNAIAVALELQRALPEPFEYARSLQIQGRVERGARNWGAARRAFGEALERFDQLGAARWAEQAAADLARLPGRRPGDKQTLTRREREVAELVAAGLANKEVAARLFVSLRSVEANLSKVYAKLGVRSRSELAGRLNRLGGP